MTNAESIVEQYNKKYGKRIKDTLADTINDMIKFNDGDSIALLYSQLMSAADVIKSMVNDSEIFVWNHEPKKMN